MAIPSSDPEAQAITASAEPESQLSSLVYG